VSQAVTGGGGPLDSASLAFFQAGFGHDFSSVRVHAGSAAAASAEALSARAYTVGRHVVLGSGAPAAESAAGRRFLGHELAHVVQQGRGGSARADAPALEAEADLAAQSIARGERVDIAGGGSVGVARQSLFADFNDGKYSWVLLKDALTYGRPVATIVKDVNALSSADRDQAVADILRERKSEFQRGDRMSDKRDAQTDPDLQKLFDPELKRMKEFIKRADEVLDGLFATIAVGETKESLEAGTVAPTAAQKPLIASALKPDPAPPPIPGETPKFKAKIDGDELPYIKKLRLALLPIVKRMRGEYVDKKGKAEHDDPSKVHALSEFERIGTTSKDETDKVFGQYKKGPPIKADRPGRRGNLHDKWKEMGRSLNLMGKGGRRNLARVLIFYFFQTEGAIAAINKLHFADPKFSGSNVPANDEATDQATIADESTATPADVERLNEIDRGWDASANGRDISIQLFKKPDRTDGALAGPDVADRDLLWDMFQVLIHEYLHTLSHKAYDRHATRFGSNSAQFNTLIEGVDTLLDEVVWSAVEPRMGDQALRERVEGPVYAALPPITTAIKPASRRRYRSYRQALKLVEVVGIRNLYAAYFLGDVEKIDGH
jgi:hypothetical protein